METALSGLGALGRGGWSLGMRPEGTEDPGGLDLTHWADISMCVWSLVTEAER